MFKYLILLLFLSSALQGIEYHSLVSYLQSNPFSYDLGITSIEGESSAEDVLLCCHGFGGNERMISGLHAHGIISNHLVGFRFPDYGKLAFIRPPQELAYGTIQELLPLLYLIKRIVIDAGTTRINLYGFSAGGGTIINALAVLNEGRFPEELQSLGIGPSERQQILEALQAGFILLDCPLKSLEEIIAFRGALTSLEIVNKHYAENRLIPIENLSGLIYLKLKFFLYFEHPDLILSNRDDALFIERLKLANSQGETKVLIGQEGGHAAFHSSLWNAYYFDSKKKSI